MQQDLNMEVRIQAYMDQECNEAESKLIEQKIATDPVWEEHYHAILGIHELLSTGLEPMEPSMRFTRNVMDEIKGLEIARPLNQFMSPWVFRIAGGILGSLLIFILGYAVTLIDFSSGTSNYKIQIPSVQIPEVIWSKYLGQGTTILLFMVCTILAFYLADKLLIKKSSKYL